MDEGPDREVVHWQAARCQLANQATQREVLRAATLNQPGVMGTGDRALLVATHLSMRHTSRARELTHPADRSRHAYTKPLPCRARRLSALHSRHNPMREPIEYARAISAGLRPANRVDHMRAASGNPIIANRPNLIPL